MNDGERGFLLRTLGFPVLTGPGGEPVGGLRRKDLSLLAYLVVEGPRPHSRSRLAALLWGESPESKALHSLTQALGRIRRATGSGTVVVERDKVRSTGAVACDAVWLLAGDEERLDSLLTLYDGPFLEGFEPGFGSEDFGDWADRRRRELRDAALRWLEKPGTEAEGVGDWPLALRIGERGAEVDDMHEGAHRRVLRALLETGERNRALRYYEEFAARLADEPDPETTVLYERIRDATAASASPPPRVPPPPPPPPPIPDEPPQAEPPALDEAAAVNAVAAEDETAEIAPHDPPPPAAPAARDVASPRAGWREGGARHALLWLLAGALTVVLLQVAVGWLFGPSRRPVSLPGHGESIRAQKGGPVYLAYGEMLWRYPDDATLDRCLGGWRQRIRRVQALPRWPRRTLPSVAGHPWQGGMDAVVTDRPQYPTQYVAVGCVLAPIPDTLTFREIFGHTDWSRSHEEADPVLRASPGTREAHPYPVRAAGTLIQGAAGGEVKWIVYHGGALTTTSTVLATYCRALAEVVPVTDAEFDYYRAYAALPPADGPCRP